MSLVSIVRSGLDWEKTSSTTVRLRKVSMHDPALLTMVAGEPMPADPAWRAFTVAFYKWLSTANPDRFPIAPNPVRLMPGGLDRIVADGFTLLGSGKLVERTSAGGSEPWMRPISGEKLVYHL